MSFLFEDMSKIIFLDDQRQQENVQLTIIFAESNFLFLKPMKNSICCPEMAEYLNTPHVSLVIPFEPKMKNKIQLQKMLTGYAAETEKDLLEKYEPDEVRNVIKKLKSVISKIDDPADKSIAIFISRSTEKVIYFDHSDYVQNHPLPKY